MSEDVTSEEFTEKSDDEVTPRESIFGEIPSNWSASDLDDPELFSVTSSGLEPFDGEKTYVPTGEVEGGEIIGDDGAVSYDDRPSRANLAVEEGDVLFAKMKDSIKVVRATQDLSEDYIFSTGFVRVTTTDSVNSDFLKQILLSNRFNQSKDSLAIGSTQPAINLSDLSALSVPVPPIDEQRKIASVLYTVDQTIQKTEEIIEQTERVRRGTEQDVLSRGVREDGTLRPDDDVEYRSSWVGEIPCGWDVKQYSELISDSSVGIVVKPSQYYDDEGTVSILRSKDISRDGIVDGDFEYMSEESNAANENSQLQEGDVITVRSGDPGLSCVVDGEFDGANCADLLISTPGPKLDPHYAAMWINSFAGRKQIDRFQAGLAQKHFNLGALRKLRVGVPSLDEQKRIVEKVSSISESLESQIKYKKQLQRLKQGLMQDLLSGEVRTHDRDIEIVDEVLQHG